MKRKDKGWRVGEKKEQLHVLQACCEINEEERETRSGLQMSGSNEMHAQSCHVNGEFPLL